jgi:hypothetical protein
MSRRFHAKRRLFYIFGKKRRKIMRSDLDRTDQILWDAATFTEFRLGLIHLGRYDQSSGAHGLGSH